MSSVVGLVELHDACIKDIQICASGLVIVRFSHVAVYEKVGNDRFAIVSFAAELFVENTVLVKVYRAIASTNQLAALKLDNEEVSSQLWTDAILAARPLSCRNIQLAMTDGTTAEFEATSVKMQLGTRGDEFDAWEGPLLA